MYHSIKPLIPLVSMATICAYSPLDAGANEPVKIHINATMKHTEWAPHIERCIQRGIAMVANSPSAVAFTSYGQSLVDLFVVTQPIKEQAGHERGVGAAVVADVRASGLPPHILVVTAQASRTGMAYICRSAVELFYEKIAIEYLKAESLFTPGPIDAFEADFPNLD